MDTILRQNKIEMGKEKMSMRILKRIVKENRGNKKGSLILETDEETHEMLIKNGRVSIGWRKYRVFEHINVRRCFKCWGFYHIAMNCRRETICHSCASNHKENECKEKRKQCVNCMHKVRTYNLKINIEHDALDLECPTYKKALREERRRAGGEYTT